jgi:WD40 repeat protein
VSGSDDGNIELWSVQKKKPVYIVKNAHTSSTDVNNGELKDNGRNYNGHIGKYKVSCCPFTASLRKLESSCGFEILFGVTT